MAQKYIYACQSCGQKFSKWMGRCSTCGEWNSVSEERAPLPSARKNVRGKNASPPPQPIASVSAENVTRWPTDISELDRVLGGGLVPGSAVLIGGEPGVGKSTLLLQCADRYAQMGHRVLYVTGEESISQIAMRAARLDVTHESLLVYAETDLTAILEQVEETKPQVLIVDSIQTMAASELESQPGSVGQIRECAIQITSFTKARSMASFLVGHVTKEGSIAGPKILEHMVDVVLYFEGTSSQSLRMLRSIKNRYGSTNEVGVFDIQSTGLREVTNPSELFLSERAQEIPGSVIVPSVEGTRALLVEVQALASPTPLANPRRTAIGLDSNRISLLVAILEKRGGFRLFDQDIYVNVAGGLRLSEPASDLGVLAALISSYTGKTIPNDSIFFGEVGLGGEVRGVPRAADRLREAARLGLRRAFLPKKVVDELKSVEGISLEPIAHVQELSDFL